MFRSRSLISRFAFRPLAFRSDPAVTAPPSMIEAAQQRLAAKKATRTLCRVMRAGFSEDEAASMFINDLAGSLSGAQAR